MTLHTIYTRCTELELQHWEFCKMVKSNPVRHPEIGDVFLREFFRVANPEIVLPKERLKRSDKSSVWYSADQPTVMRYFIGNYLKRQKGDRLSVVPWHGCEYLFPYIWYLLCLYDREENGKAGRTAEEIGKGVECGDAGKEPAQEEIVRTVEYCLEDGKLVARAGQPPDREKSRRFLMEMGEHTEFCSTGARNLLGDLVRAYRMFYNKAADFAGEAKKESLDALFHFELCDMFVYMAECLECRKAGYADIGGENTSNVPVLKYSDDPLLYLLCLSDAINLPGGIRHGKEKLEEIDLEYVREDGWVEIQIGKEFGGTEDGKKYIDRLKRVVDKIDVQMDVSIR